MSEQRTDLSSPTSLPEEPRFTNVATAPLVLTENRYFLELSRSGIMIEYMNLVERVLSPDNMNVESELKIIIKSLIDLGPQYTHLVQELVAIFWSTLFSNMDPSLYESLSKFAIENTEQKENMVYTTVLIAHALVSLYSIQGRTREGISLLKKLPLNSSESNIPLDFKIETYLLIVSMTHGTSTPLANDAYLVKTRDILKTYDNGFLKYMCYVYYAQSLDFRGRYFDSLRILFRLNQVTCNQIDISRKLRRLAIVGTLLIPVCLIRAEFLAILCSDSSYHEVLPLAILNKLNTFEVIVPEEYKAIEKLLNPHHKANKYDGVPVLEYFTCEHNLYSMSRVNSSVTLEELENVLNLKPDLVEKVAAKMVSTKRLCAKIDNGLIHFNSPL